MASFLNEANTYYFDMWDLVGGEGKFKKRRITSNSCSNMATSSEEQDNINMYRSEGLY